METILDIDYLKLFVIFMFEIVCDCSGGTISTTSAGFSSRLVIP